MHHYVFNKNFFILICILRVICVFVLKTHPFKSCVGYYCLTESFSLNSVSSLRETNNEYMTIWLYDYQRCLCLTLFEFFLRNYLRSKSNKSKSKTGQQAQTRCSFFWFCFVFLSETLKLCNFSNWY